MASKNRALAPFALCFAFILAVAVASVYLISTTPTLPSTLPIPAGTVIPPPYLEVGFIVEGGPANLIGAWDADHGGLFWVGQANESTGPIAPVCGPSSPWTGTVNVSLLPGRYVLGFAPNPSGTVVITEAVALVFPGSSPVAFGFVDGWGCSPRGVAPPQGAGSGTG